MLGTVAHAYNPSVGRPREADPWPTVEFQADDRYFFKKEKKKGRSHMKNDCLGCSLASTYTYMHALVHIPSHAATHTHT